MEFKLFQKMQGGIVSKALHMKVFGALALLGAGLFLTGCKPDLAEANALALIQAKYDQTPAVAAAIILDNLGLKMGITDGYWQLTKVYPNRFWADYTLTDAGKKLVTIDGGGAVIQWRPDSATDTNFSVSVMTVAANHLKAHDIRSLQDEVLPGVDTAKGAQFTESVNLDGVPGPLQDIAHNPGNRLATKRQADFSLEGGAWKLHSIE
jgi:hypothetical protein